MRLGKWIIADHDSHVNNISDSKVIEHVEQRFAEMKVNNMTLIAITPEGQKTWTPERELAEMKGHLNGFIRSKYGREMLDAHKLALAQDIKLGRA
jgi:hypothetical protein